MKKHIIIHIIIGILMLGACSDETNTYTVTLLDSNEEVLQTYAVDENDVIVLPVLEEEGLMFIGWGEDLSYGEITVTEDLRLVPEFENPEEVFTTEEEIGDRIITYVTGYVGRGKYLKIPETIGNDLIGGIDTHAFLESDLVEVWIPNTVQYVNEEAFKDMDDLRKVSFLRRLCRTQERIDARGDL